MEPINLLHESDSDESCTLSLRDLPLQSNGEPSQTHNPFSAPTDLFDFSFPLPPAEEKSNSTSKFDAFVPNNFASTAKLPPLFHRRAESFGGSHGEAHSVDYQMLRRACSDPRPNTAGGMRRRWPLFALGSAKFPAEMEMRNIRSRQRRQGPPEVDERCSRRICWSIFRALSCKAAESAAVASAPVAFNGGGNFRR